MKGGWLAPFHGLAITVVERPCISQGAAVSRSLLRGSGIERIADACGEQSSNKTKHEGQGHGTSNGGMLQGGMKATEWYEWRVTD
jgi:hypothetical protein